MTLSALSDEILIRRPPKKAVLLFHGYGDSGSGMKAFSQSLATLLPPEVAFFCPTAPDAVSFYPGGFEWFPLPDYDPDALASADSRLFLSSLVFHKERLLKLLVPYVEKIKKDHGFSSKDLIVSGFSQGGFIALLLGACLKEQVSGVVSFSGVPFLDDSARRMPPTLLIHGEEDTTVPVSMFDAEKIFLMQKKISYESLLVPDMGHEIFESALTTAARFIRTCFAF